MGLYLAVSLQDRKPPIYDKICLEYPHLKRKGSRDVPGRRENAFISSSSMLIFDMMQISVQLLMLLQEQERRNGMRS